MISNMSNTIKLINKQFIQDINKYQYASGILLFEKKDTRVYNILDQLKIPSVLSSLIFEYTIIHYEFEYTIKKYKQYDNRYISINIHSTKNNMMNTSLIIEKYYSHCICIDQSDILNVTHKCDIIPFINY